MVQPNDIVIWMAAFVAVWWLFDWINMRQEGERLPLRRAPLRVLGDVLPKLWRNKTFMLILLSLWLIGAAVLGVQGYFYRISTDLPREASESAPAFQRALNLTDTAPELLAEQLPEALPRLVEIPLGPWAELLFGVLVIAALVRVMIDPPDAIDAGLARNLKWPIALVVTGIAAEFLVPQITQELWDSWGGETSEVTVRGWFRLTVLFPALMAPAHVLLWRLVLEIARDGVWSFVTAIRAVAKCWLPATLLLVAANLARPLPTDLFDGWAAMPWVYNGVLVLLFLIPWAIVDQQADLLAALKRSWRLVRLKPVDALAFGLRFTLLFAVLGGLIALAEPSPAAVWGAWYAPLLDVVRDGLLLLQALVLARFYVHLSEMLAEDEACASCPSARMAERLEEQTSEEQ